MKTRLKIFTTILYVLACCAFLPQMQAGTLPPEIPGNPDGGYSGLNTAEGSNALNGPAPFTGVANTGVGWEALNFSGSANLNTGLGAGAGALITGNFNTATGAGAQLLNLLGTRDTANGAFALEQNITGTDNTAIGSSALFNNDLTANGLANGNTAVGSSALASNIDGASNTAVGLATLLHSFFASGNTAIGDLALLNNDNTGNGFANFNTAVGDGALQNNIDAFGNTAIGALALRNNDSSGTGTARFNTAVGGSALTGNTDGESNTAVGFNARENSPTGTVNTAVGRRALQNLDGGHENTAVGWGAGGNYSGTETNNICIGDQTAGVTGESNAIRIGDNSTSGGIDLLDGGAGANFILIGTGMGTQGISVSSLLGFGTVQIGNGLSTVALASSCNIGGIYNQSFGPADMAVRIGSDNKLGTVVSSRRFKHDIEPIDKASEAILTLKPVTFHYNSDTTNTPRFGLIAEDVAEVSPQLVIPDKEGKPLSVRYEDVYVMLLNEFLKEHKKVEEQQLRITDLNYRVAKQDAIIAQQQKGMDVLTAQLKEQAAQIQKVSAQLEVNKAAPQVVVNKP